MALSEAAINDAAREGLVTDDGKIDRPAVIARIIDFLNHQTVTSLAEVDQKARTIEQITFAVFQSNDPDLRSLVAQLCSLSANGAVQHQLNGNGKMLCGKRMPRTWIQDGVTETSSKTCRFVRYGLGDHAELPAWTEAYVHVYPVNSKEASYARVVEREVFRAAPETKREAFARLSRDPEVVSDPQIAATVVKEIAQANKPALEEAYRDQPTYAALSDARTKVREELIEPLRQAEREVADIFKPKGTTLERHVFLADVAKKVDQWARELDAIRGFLAETEGDVDHLQRWSTGLAMDRLVQAATACRDVLPSSSVAPAEEPSHHHSRRVLAKSRT
jgi:hypothetical protein